MPASSRFLRGRKRSQVGGILQQKVRKTNADQEDAGYWLEWGRGNVSEYLMKSPIARDQFLKKVEIENGLVAYECPVSHGYYIPLQNYWTWLNKQSERLAHLPAEQVNVPKIVERDMVKLCPESDTVMLRYKVGHDFGFTVDRSITGGVWFDQGEWEALKQRQFHDEVHLIFTAPWQQAVQKDEAKQLHEKVMKEKFEPELLADIQDLRKRLADHPNKEYAMAYIQS